MQKQASRLKYNNQRDVRGIKRHESSTQKRKITERTVKINHGEKNYTNKLKIKLN